MKIVGTLLVTLVGLADVHAATKLCIPGAGDTFDVPERPSFIVERARLDRSLRVARNLGRDAETFSYSIENVDDYYARITVDANAGDVFIDPGFVGRGCKGRSFRVVKTWKPGAVAWTRTDWTYTEADLANGLYGSRMTGAEPDFDDLARDIGTRAAFVRTIRYLPDGSVAESRGWLDASMPHASSSPSVCAPTLPARTVPVDPTFSVDEFRTPRFVAIATHGSRLPVTITPQRWKAHVTVHAPEGTTFQLLRLPLGGECEPAPLLHATADRSRDVAPNVVAVEKGYSWSTNPTFWGTIGLRLARGPWEQLDLDWAHSLAELGGEPYRADLAADDLTISTVVPGLPEGVPDDFTQIFVRITPRWSGVAGRAWTGWVRRDVATGAFTFGQIDEPVEAPRPSYQRLVTPRRIHVERTATHRRDDDALLLLLLVAGLVALARASYRVR